MTEPTSKSPPQAKFTHYVSNENGAVHPAMTSPAGYEDEHPTEWRRATSAEIEQYKKGVETTTPPEPVSINARAENASSPQAITLSDDGAAEVETTTGAPVVPEAAPVVPAPAIPAPAIPAAPKKG